MKISIVSSKSFSIKKSGKFVAAFAVLGAFSVSNVFAAPAVDTATTTATIVTPITISDAQQLNFGSFAAGTGGTIELKTDGSATAGGDVFLTDVITTTAAQFTVSGESNESYSIEIDNTVLTHTDTTTTMAMTTTHDLDGAAEDEPADGTLSGAGLQTIYVGGTLTVGSGQIAGVYSGTITATVNYN